MVPLCSFQVTDSQPEDVEAWIEYAQLLDNDMTGALEAYLKALAILENIQLDIAPEILNNIAALYFMKGNHEQSSVRTRLCVCGKTSYVFSIMDR